MQLESFRRQKRLGMAMLLLITAFTGFPPDVHAVQPVGATVNLPSMEISAISVMTPTCALSRQILSTCVGPIPCGPAEVMCEDQGGGIGIVAAGTGLRNTGNGTITLRGVPDGSRLLAAVAYWAFISRSPNETLSLNGEIDGRPFKGELMGSTFDLCWDDPPNPATRLYAASADVTELMSAGVDGTYTVALGGSALANGQDPWAQSPSPSSQLTTANLLEGLTLVVLYSHESLPDDSVVYLHDGPRRLKKTLQLSHQLTPPLEVQPTQVRHLVVAADGQQPHFGFTLAPYELGIHAGGFSFIPLAGEPQSPNPGPILGGFEGSATQQLWDTHDLTGTFASPFMPAGTQFYDTHYAEQAGVFDETDCVAIVADALALSGTSLTSQEESSEPTILPSR